jgi:hypothetical protein
MNRRWSASDVADRADVGGQTRGTKPPSHFALGENAAGTDLAVDDSGNPRALQNADISGRSLT